MRGHYVVEYETGYPILRTDFPKWELVEIECEKTAGPEIIPKYREFLGYNRTSPR